MVSKAIAEIVFPNYVLAIIGATVRVQLRVIAWSIAESVGLLGLVAIFDSDI